MDDICAMQHIQCTQQFFQPPAIHLPLLKPISTLLIAFIAAVGLQGGQLEADFEVVDLNRGAPVERNSEQLSIAIQLIVRQLLLLLLLIHTNPGSFATNAAPATWSTSTMYRYVRLTGKN